MSDKVQGSLAGQRFGNYIAYEVLGKGGMGTVYLAEHPDIGRKVAIKVIANTDSEELVQRFLEEAKAVNKIGHPNIIDIYDFGRTSSGRLYYVMEYLEGRELSAVMTEKRRMTPAEVLPYLQQLCEAVQAAHDNGIVHRDLKPANIFVLDRHGPATMRVKVLDFGVAKLLDRPPEGGFRTMPGMMLGTPMFSAPEQAAAELKSICPQTDLYSIGVMVYWMLAGRPPFMADNNAVLMAMHMTDPPPPIRKRAPNVPEPVASLVERCLAKQPADRPASARELSSAFTSAVAGIKNTGPIPAMVTGQPLAAGSPASPRPATPVPLTADDYGNEESGIIVFVPNTPVEEQRRQARDPAAHAKDVSGKTEGEAGAPCCPVEVVEKKAKVETSSERLEPGHRSAAAQPQRGGASSSPNLDPNELPPLPDEGVDEHALEVTEVELVRDDILSLVEAESSPQASAPEGLVASATSSNKDDPSTT
ncbi:MAG: hypothetical protein CSA65_03370 [Proteobacteria bacterium]|nr:MAG: hypothetical protein CSB49_05840 [Pseudomonadota bacterium]PIE19092.1 MAG: hypothetical protein CSA65_03370 [Pseudomonadota bacterium]